MLEGGINMPRNYGYLSLILITSLFVNFSIFNAQEESNCVLWAIVEDNQVIQYDLLTGDRIGQLDFELHAIFFSRDGRYLVSHTFDNGIDVHIRTNIQTATTARVDVERQGEEFPSGNTQLNSNLEILNYSKPLVGNPRMSEKSSRRLLDWSTERSSYFPYDSGRAGRSRQTGHIGFQWYYDSTLFHDEGIQYEEFAWYSFEDKSFSFSSINHLPNAAGRGGGSDWSDAYGFIWYEYFSEQQFAWLIGESRPIELGLEQDGTWGRVQLSPNGQYLLRASYEDSIWVHDLESQETIYHATTKNNIGELEAHWIDTHQFLFFIRDAPATAFYIVDIETGEERVFYDEPLVHQVVVPETNNCE